MYDTAQTYYQLSLAYQFGDATPTLHLFSSDDTPTASVLPSSYTELTNDSYAPLPVPNGYWQFLPSPPPGFYAVMGATWDLAGPDPGDDTVFYGWWMDAFSPKLGETVYLFGGRFDSPVSIPPAGLTLTLAEVQLPLHDCGYPPPVSQQAILGDGDFETPAIPSHSFTTTPAWPPNTWTDGILSAAGSAYEPPAGSGRQGQYLVVQVKTVVTQVVTSSGNDTYRLCCGAAQRVFGTTQTVAIQVDGVGVDTISAAAAGWFLWESVPFVLGVGNHTIGFVGLNPVGGDSSMFIDHAALVLQL